MNTTPDPSGSRSVAEPHPAPRIVVTRRLTERAMSALQDLGVATHLMGTEPPSRDRLLAGVRGAAAILCMLTERMDAEVFDRAGPQLRIVANCAVGFDNVDVEEACRRGITVTNTPGVLDESTADLTLGLVLALCRRICEADRFVRAEHDWVWAPDFFTGLDVSNGTTLGIVGMGRIGQAVARRALAFGMRVLALGRDTSVPLADFGAVRRLALDELLQASDIVSLHCPLTPETHHLINAPALDQMKPRAVLINTARGELVDTEALVEALVKGRIGGAALDVFEREPAVDRRLLELPNVVLTPHIGSAGTITRERMCQLVVANVKAVLSGEQALTPVPSCGEQA